MSRLLKIYKKAAFKFIGDDENFSLEQQIFNLFSFLVCVTAFACLFINLLIGLYESAVLTFVIIITNSTILYLSRVEKKFKLSVVITGIELYTLLFINYFVNSGIAGPTVLLFLAILFLMTSVGSYKSTPFWLVLNFSLVAILFAVEYFYPNSILASYSDRLTVFQDIYATYIVMVILMSSAILYKRMAYEKQRKVLEIKASALEKLNSEKNKLFSIISHDLRAPIGSVKQYLNFIKDNSLTEDERTIIENGLAKATNEAYELLDNLLIWSKSQLGGIKPMLMKLKAYDVLTATIHKAKEYAKEKEITIIENIDNVEIMADENMLQLVIRNLLFNAIKFSEPKGVIEFSIFREKDQAILKIKDYGVGITEENQKTIFSLDVKSNIGTGKEKGTGLGLVLSREYTQLQNGALCFESTYGLGSTFYVSLPVAK